MWKIVREGAPYWKGCYDLDGDWKFSVNDERDVNLERLRSDWDLLKKIASGQSEGAIVSMASKDEPDDSNAA